MVFLSNKKTISCMMKKNGFLKKVILSSIFSMLISSANVSFPDNHFLIFNNNIVEAHYLSSNEEKMIGNAAVEKYQQKNNTGENEALTDMQKDIVENNSSTLNLYDYGKHKRFLEPVKVSYEKTMNAFTFPGGQIFITQQMLDFLNTYYDDGYTYDEAIRPMEMDIKNPCDSLYNISSIEFVLGHEIGHWANEDYLRQFDKQYNINMLFSLFGGNQTTLSGAMLEELSQKVLTDVTQRQMSLRVEEQADEKGIEYLEKSNVCSTGGAAMFFYRYRNFEKIKHMRDPSKGADAHSNTTVRLRRVFDYWEKESNGLIKFTDDTEQFLLNGKIFKCGSGLFPRTDYATAKDRTFFIAGQLSKAVRLGLLDNKNLQLYVLKYSDVGGQTDRAVIVSANPTLHPNSAIFIDKLDSSYEEIKAKINNPDSFARVTNNDAECLYAMKSCGFKLIPFD